MNEQQLRTNLKKLRIPDDEIEQKIQLIKDKPQKEQEQLFLDEFRRATLKIEFGWNEQKIEEFIQKNRIQTKNFEEQHNAWLNQLDSHFVTLMRRDEDVCFAIARLIEEEQKLSLNMVVEKSKLGRQTVYSRLKFLLKNGILDTQTVIVGRGRPLVVYFRTSKPLSSLKKYSPDKSKVRNGVVTLPFDRFASVCRFEQNRVCLRTKVLCMFENCPFKVK